MVRSIKPEEFLRTKSEAVAILDVRRESDFEASGEVASGAIWKDPAKIEEWIGSVPKDGRVIIYCVRGGGVSNSVVDRLHADGVDAQFIEGGIEGLKATGNGVEKKPGSEHSPE